MSISFAKVVNICLLLTVVIKDISFDACDEETSVQRQGNGDAKRVATAVILYLNLTVARVRFDKGDLVGHKHFDHSQIVCILLQESAMECRCRRQSVTVW